MLVMMGVCQRAGIEVRTSDLLQPLAHGLWEVVARIASWEDDPRVLSARKQVEAVAREDPTAVDWPDRSAEASARLDEASKNARLARGAVAVRSGGHYAGNEVRHYDWAVRNLVLGESCAAIARDAQETGDESATPDAVRKAVRKIAAACAATMN